MAYQVEIKQRLMFMRRAAWIFVVALMLGCLPCAPALAWFGSPTAIIVDDETGEPIEGAIALAQWIKTRFNFEGGFTYVSKARETVSDKEGKIYIKTYWMWIPFTGDTTLTVYKPGYALWNSDEYAVPLRKYRPKDFSRSRNVVRLVKFEKAAEQWKERAPSEFAKKNPHRVHSSFLSYCLESDLDREAITLHKVFDQYEWPFLKQEKAQRRREYEKSKKK